MFTYNYNLNINRPIINYNSPKALITGLEIGIPLNIFSEIFTHIHYGKNILNENTILLEFLLGYYAYGLDRYKDAIEYKNNKDNNNINYSIEKINLYKNIIQYKNIYEISLLICLFSCIYLINYQEYTNLNLYLLPLAISVQYYKELKPLLSPIKPLFISFMWTFTSVFIPAYLYENNFDIINYPIDYLPCFLILFATSNFADIKDIDEDKNNNVNTLPVIFGERNSNLITFITIVIASLMYTESSYFNQRPIIDTLVELQNFGLMYLTYNNTFTP